MLPLRAVGSQRQSCVAVAAHSALLQTALPLDNVE
jgi:hypothetical protein